MPRYSQHSKLLILLAATIAQNAGLADDWYKIGTVRGRMLTELEDRLFSTRKSTKRQND